MYESPKSLQQVCIDFICDHVMELCDVYFSCGRKYSPALHGPLIRGPPISAWHNERVTNGLEVGIIYNKMPSIATKLTFKQSDVFLPAEVADQLIASFSEKKILSDLTITLFDAKCTRLRHVRLKDVSSLSEKGLQILRQHRIVELVANGLALSYFGNLSLQDLRSFTVIDGTCRNVYRYFCNKHILSKMKALHTFNVCGTDLGDSDFNVLMHTLSSLENLDISRTKVQSISASIMRKDQLKTLSMYGLTIRFGLSLVSVLLELNELRSLDISNVVVLCVPKDPSSSNEGQITGFLKATHCMPHLESLDLSGQDGINADDLRKFIKAHPHLTFLGLFYSDVCYHDCFVNPANEDYRPNLLVSGTATEAQILEALRRYTSRPVYVEECLFYLFRLTPYFLGPRVHVIKLVLLGMANNPWQFDVQMAATACLYNLIKGEFVFKIHPSILKQIVDLTLAAMEKYPNDYQLQKNALLTLCSDRILQDVTFDKYRCATLVMDCLSRFDDTSMNRISVAICSILAAKISSAETSMLGARPQYMSKLLDMVRAKIISKSVDITMKFTLSALWNLTDECATTCEVFLEEGGMELFLDVLEIFRGEFSVETKVLGLLNNIAEVIHLRPRLMTHRFILLVSVLLRSSHIDVSYFAAGIIAHLLSDWPSTWPSVMTLVPTKDELLIKLAYAVTHWQTPQGEMVAYRSFQPFFPLLRCFDAYPVQLWAVWAIHHVCTKNPKRYCSMLVREGGVEILKHLKTMHPEVNTTKPNVRKLCQSILETIEKNP